MSVSRAVVRSRLGGRWAVSWQGYLLLLPVSVPLALPVVPALATSSTWVTGLAVALIAYGATGLVLWTASLTLLRRRREQPVPILLTVLVGGIAWAARSAVFVVGLGILDLTSDTGVGQRLMVGFFLGALFVPGAAWVLASLDEFRTERRHLLAQLVQAELGVESSRAYLAVMREDLLDRIDAQLRAAAALPDQPAVGTAQEQVVLDAAQIERIESAVRTTSRELARATWDQARHDSRVTTGAVAQAVTRRPYTLWPLVPYLVIGVLFVQRFEPLGTTILAFVTIGALSVIVCASANVVARAGRLLAVVGYVISMLLLLLSGLLTRSLWAATPVGEPFDIAVALAAGFLVAVIMVAGGVARAVNVTSEEILNDVRSSISESEIRSAALTQEEARTRQEIALHLHGTVAANVTAALLRLRQAIDEGDLLVAQAAMMEARQQLDTDLRASILVEHSDVRTLLDGVANSWQGIATVVADVDGEPEPSPERVRDIVNVVTEAVSNAVRHGDAQTIRAHVRMGGDGVEITVHDDGRARAVGDPGLGSTLFDQVAPRRWSRLPDPDGGTVLRVEMFG